MPMFGEPLPPEMFDKITIKMLFEIKLFGVLFIVIKIHIFFFTLHMTDAFKSFRVNSIQIVLLFVCLFVCI